MTDTKAKLTALMDNPFAGYHLTERQGWAATWSAFGFSRGEIAKEMLVTEQAVYHFLVGARKKIGLSSNRDFTKQLIRQIKLILEME